jgi:hypothetical protein
LLRPAASAFTLAAVCLNSSTLASNLIINGDFELGNSNFGSQLAYVAPVEDSLFPETVYTITANPNTPINLNLSGTTNYFDHTLGNADGLFMACNGPTAASSAAWFYDADDNNVVDQLAVTPNTDYTFSAWISTWSPHNVPQARIQFRINGVLLGSPVSPNAPPNDGTWSLMSFTWNSQSNTFADLAILDLDTTQSGNDFGLDDVSFSPVPEPTSLIAFAMITAPFLLRRSRRSKA